MQKHSAGSHGDAAARSAGRDVDFLEAASHGGPDVLLQVYSWQLRGTPENWSRAADGR